MVQREPRWSSQWSTLVVVAPLDMIDWDLGNRAGACRRGVR
jgi:hypothetical protein